VSDEIYEASEIRSVMAEAEPNPTGRRDVAIIHTLWASGLRCAELCNLKPDDIDRRHGAVWVAAGKGDKSRTVILPRASRSELWVKIDRWLTDRNEFAWTDSTLFCSLQGRRLDESYIRHMLAGLAIKAGVERRFHPHGLRHTFTARMHLSGVPLSVIQRQLGHSDLSVTGKYLKRIGMKALDEQMADFSLE
jgi:site-specific recombinase XerD